MAMSSGMAALAPKAFKAGKIDAPCAAPATGGITTCVPATAPMSSGIFPNPLDLALG